MRYIVFLRRFTADQMGFTDEDCCSRPHNYVCLPLKSVWRVNAHVWLSVRHEWNLGQNPGVEDMTGACQVQQEQNKRDDDDDDDTIVFHLKNMTWM